jgi:PrtD family type I secretion system ABC transporter
MFRAAGWQRFLAAPAAELRAATATGFAGELRAAIHAFRSTLITGLPNLLSLTRSPASLARTFHAARAHVDAGWQRFLAAPAAELAIPTTPGLAGELRAAIRAFRSALIGVGVATGLINLLSLTGPLFMLQVYDRVLPSRSLPTLGGLALLVLVLFAFQGLLDLLRGRILLRIGRGLDEKLSPRAFEIMLRAPRHPHAAVEGLQSIRDLDHVRSFASSVGLTAFFDLPWMPLYVAVCFLFHPVMGFAVLFGALVICSLTVLTERLTREPSRASVALAAARHKLAEAARRNAALIQALGMRGRMGEQWMRANDVYLQSQQTANDIVVGFGSLSRVLRIIVQSAVLGIGAYLVINQEATAGVMLAATVLSARALAPVELAIANWKAFVTARQGWLRLSEALTAIPIEEERIGLPPPARNLRLTAVTLVPPGMGAAALHDVSFSLTAGNALGVIGPTGSGKTSLARALVGVLKPVRGTIRLDGATLDQWSPDVFGRFIGYLPQEVELFEGTVAENIARFESDADPTRLIAAATAAGVHDVILRLPQGYKTPVGEGGALLSGGQRQRIALARALYGDPFLVVLDEPNSNLDAPGEQALAAAIGGIRARGGIAVVIAHRPSAVAAVDHILVLNEGRVQAFGPREQILQQVGQPTPTEKQHARGGRSHQ